MNFNLMRFAPLIAVPAALLGWWLDPRAFLACYLVVWWCWMSLCLGLLANIWLHTLSGGAWGGPLRAPAHALAASVPLAALLFLPVLGGLHFLYPWATAGNWDAGVALPAFKRIWLSPAFFIGRAAGYLLLWSALAWLTRQPAVSRRQGFAAAALIAYGLSVSMAASDWIMSLIPLWYSSIFGLVCGVVQMLGGMALAILIVTPGVPQLLADWGNLLLMYVFTWAYLEYVQFLIIWSANLPHEIIWYLSRSQEPWLAVNWLLALGMFGLPLMLLLLRKVKRNVVAMRRLAVWLLVMVLVHTCWLVLPSLHGPATHWLFALPLAVLTVSALACMPYVWRRVTHV